MTGRYTLNERLLSSSAAAKRVMPCVEVFAVQLAKIAHPVKSIFKVFLLAIARYAVRGVLWNMNQPCNVINVRP